MHTIYTFWTFLYIFFFILGDTLAYLNLSLSWFIGWTVVTTTAGMRVDAIFLLAKWPKYISHIKDYIT